MDAILKTIISKISWDAYLYYADGVNDLALRVYIAQQLRALEQLEGASDKKVEKATDIIEATIVETPDEIKEIEDKEEQKRHFETYVKNIVNGNVYGVNGNIEDGANLTQTFHIGDVHNHPKS